jgi:hypothetical protein
MDADCEHHQKDAPVAQKRLVPGTKITRPRCNSAGQAAIQEPWSEDINVPFPKQAWSCNGSATRAGQALGKHVKETNHSKVCLKLSSQRNHSRRHNRHGFAYQQAPGTVNIKDVDTASMVAVAIPDKTFISI